MAIADRVEGETSSVPGRRQRGNRTRAPLSERTAWRAVYDARMPRPFAFAVAATAVLAACRSAAPEPAAPTPTDDRAIRIRIAVAEATRGAGLAELVELATREGDARGRALAIRGLGRIGGPAARATLLTLLADPEPAVIAASAGAIGVAALLDEPAPAELTAPLVAALARVPDAAKPVVIEAIGRAADASAQRALLPLLAGPADLASAAALACARHGRRKIELDDQVRLALIALTASDVARSYAAVAALAREHRGAALTTSAVAARQRLAPALIARVGDDVPEIRAQAILALARHELVAEAHPALEQALLDEDWRVAVEAVRALTGASGDDAGRDATAAALVRRFAELERGAHTEAHVVIEGLRALGPHAQRPRVSTALSAIATRAAASTTLEALTYGWIGCLASSALIRASETPDLTWVDQCKLPDHLRLPLIGELVVQGVGAVAARRAAVAQLLAHADPRVRAAGLPALVALWKDSGAADREAAIATLAGALGAADPIVAGTAVEAATPLYDAIGGGDHAALDAAVIARARRETDAELASALLELIGKRTLAAGLEACRGGLAGPAAVRKAARTCLSALGEAVVAGEVPPVSRPPVEVDEVIGATILWHLTTTRGPVTIALAPDVAPWAVATIVTLTRKGFYDGLELHRVVPGFVVQGGDPTMSGWGGAGFTLPSEPATVADGAGFVAGGVGIADAGRDSGGSQWFVMHARAAHLDGRYTWIGSVRAGQKSADALLIGDRIERATITIDRP